MKKVFLAFVLMLFFSCRVWAEDSTKSDIFKNIADDAISFFSPISGSVTNVEGNLATIAIGRPEGVREGMRLKVFREGDDFAHPVTGEILGKIESEVGSAEVYDVDNDKSVVKIVNGEVAIGDRLRISGGTLPVLFYQTKSVDWPVGDALYRAFKNSGRFDVHETELDKDDAEMMLSEVNRNKSVFGVYMRQIKDGQSDILHVSLYHPDGTKFYNTYVELPKEKLNDLKFGYNFLEDVESSFQLSFEVPSATDFVSSCDVDGNGEDELVMIIGKDIEVFQFSTELKVLYYRDIGTLNDVIWLDCDDLDNDKRSEIIFTSISEKIDDVDEDSKSGIVKPAVAREGVASHIFSLKQGKLVTQYNTPGFLRSINGKLYFQDYARHEGYSGNVYMMKHDNGWVRGKALQLPAGSNIYDFIPVTYSGVDGYLIVDESAYINLYNNDGVRVWRSKNNLGGFLREYEIPAPTEMMQADSWLVKDRIMPYKGSFIMMKRVPLAENAKGLGFSSADVIALTFKGIVPDEAQILRNIGGTMLDFTVIDEKLAVLVRPFLGMKMGNIFKGKSPFKRNLYVFSLQ